MGYDSGFEEEGTEELVIEKNDKELLDLFGEESPTDNDDLNAFLTTINSVLGKEVYVNEYTQKLVVDGQLFTFAKKYNCNKQYYNISNGLYSVYLFFL